MESSANNDPFTVFEPRLGRFIALELWAAVLSILATGTLLAVLGTLKWVGLLTTAGAAFLGVVLGATLLRRSRRILIGDTWVEGPDEESSRSTTVQFGAMDQARSGVQGGRLRILSLSGRGIKVKTGWFSPEDVEEIERLLRDRCEAVAQSASAS